MRTTVSINDALWEHVRLYASSRGMKLSRALEELVQRGLAPRPLPARPNGKRWVPFDAPPDAPFITTARLKKLIEEMDDEEDAARR